MILAIDPGNIESGVVVIREEDLKPVYAEKINNQELFEQIKFGDLIYSELINHVVIEKIASYGMAVGATVFDTCIWIGKFEAAAGIYFGIEAKYIYRKDEKINLCNSMKAKDSNIIQALVDRFAPNTPNKGKGSKKVPGWFYGFKKDIWQAYAVGVTYYDLYIKGGKENE